MKKGGSETLKKNLIEPISMVEEWIVEIKGGTRVTDLLIIQMSDGL